jgi:hypothetical protein
MTVSRYKITHFDVVSVGKIGAVVGLIVGFIYGLIFSFMVGVFGAATAGFGPLAGLGVLLIFVLMVVGGAIAGFIGGIIYTFVYNVAASLVGPIEVDLET